VSICFLQLALPPVGKHSNYAFVVTHPCSNCLDVLAGITGVCDTTGACVSRASIQRPLADVERLLVLQRSVNKLPLPCNSRRVPGCARRETHCMDETQLNITMFTLRVNSNEQRTAVPITFRESVDALSNFLLCCSTYLQCT